MLSEVKAARQAATACAGSVAGMAAAVVRVEHRHAPTGECAGRVAIARMQAREIAARTAELLSLLGAIEREVAEAQPL